MNARASKERLALVDESFERTVLPTLADYVTIECLSPAFDAQWAEHHLLHDAAQLLKNWCNERVVESRVDLVEMDGRTPVLFAEVTATPGAEMVPTTLIYGHLDKQPALGPWRDGLAAFAAVRDGDRLYGRGTADDGYAIFAAFTALEIAAREPIAHGRVIILIEASEESGSPDLDAYVDHLADRIGVPGLVICLDSGCPTYDRLWTTTSLRGVLVATLTVEVMNEGVHSGLAGGIVPSSFRIARELLSRVEDPHTGAILLPQFHAELSSEQLNAFTLLADEFGEEVAGQFPLMDDITLLGNSTAERIANGTWHPAMEVIGIGGAPQPEDAGNVLRASTTLRLAIRLPPPCDAAAAGAALKSMLEANPPDTARVTMTIDQPADGWLAPTTAPWLTECLNRASLDYFGAPARSIGLGGSIPFMADLGHRFPGVQFVATGVLGPESNAHGPNEFLHLPTAKAITATIVDLLSAAQRAHAHLGT